MTKGETSALLAFAPDGRRPPDIYYSDPVFDGRGQHRPRFVNPGRAFPQKRPVYTGILVAHALLGELYWPLGRLMTSSRARAVTAIFLAATAVAATGSSVLADARSDAREQVEF